VTNLFATILASTVVKGFQDIIAQLSVFGGVVGGFLCLFNGKSEICGFYKIIMLQSDI